jgi:prolipoprotein diacylglyceryltransferase
VVFGGKISLTGWAPRRVFENLCFAIRTWNGGLAIGGVVAGVGLFVVPVLVFVSIRVHAQTSVVPSMCRGS